LVVTLALFVGLAPAQAAAKAKSSPRASSHRSAPASGFATVDTAAVAAEVDPAVVDINTVLDPLEGGGTAAGTGMLVSPSGEIVTNNHVVQGADTVSVAIPGHGVHPAALVGTDPSADIAVLKVAGLGDLPTVGFGDSASVVVGDPVVAIGNALGLGGSPTVTEGIISATGRTITAQDETGSNQEVLHGLLQTDAPISPGNSGGPLVDGAGQVIGMDTAAASAGTVGASLGFAIPANTVRVIAGEIEAHKDLAGFVYGRAAFLGVEVVDSSAPGGLGYGLVPIATTPNGTPGVVVTAVDPGSPAASSGIASGNIITAVDGHATPSTSALSKLIQAERPGEHVSLTVATQSGTETLQVRLGQAPIA
jgi:S1-C subfamily serine protease